MSNKDKRVAALDIGTNTFHLIVFEKRGDDVYEVFRKRHHVFLSENGIETIGDEPLRRAMNAIVDFEKVLERYENIEVEIVATEALRIATNGQFVADYIEAHIPGKVNIIKGEREAELIAKGVIWAQGTLNNGLIVDIGGGSVEFIHVVNNQIKWLNSFPVGIGVVYNRFEHGEPIEKAEIEQIKSFLDTECHDLIEYLKTIEPIEEFSGASGSFELLPILNNNQLLSKEVLQFVEKKRFQQLRDLVYSKDPMERMHIKGLPVVRVQLIVVSFIIMDWIIEKVKLDKIGISKYAVKEGIVCEYFNNNKEIIA